MENNKTIKLKYPVKTAGNTEITELTFRRAKGKDLRIMDTTSGQVSKLIVLAAALTGQSPKIIDELDAIDLNEVFSVMADFLGNATLKMAESEVVTDTADTAQ